MQRIAAALLQASLPRLLRSHCIGAAGTERLAGVLGQCAALAHLNLNGNKIGEEGAERLARVLGQCLPLAHLDFRGYDIGTVGKERLRASWRGQASGLVL